MVFAYLERGCGANEVDIGMVWMQPCVGVGARWKPRARDKGSEE